MSEIQLLPLQGENTARWSPGLCFTQWATNNAGKKNNHIEALFGEIQDDLEALLNDGYSLKFH